MSNVTVRDLSSNIFIIAINRLIIDGIDIFSLRDLLKRIRSRDTLRRNETRGGEGGEEEGTR